MSYSERIAFRPLTRADFSLLQAWFAEPHIARWWRESCDPRDIEAKYGPRVEGAEPTHVFIVELGRAPVGWIQWYRWSDYPEHATQLGAAPNSAGIDLAIGDSRWLGRGLGPVLIRTFVDHV